MGVGYCVYVCVKVFVLQSVFVCAECVCVCVLVFCLSVCQV